MGQVPDTDRKARSGHLTNGGEEARHQGLEPARGRGRTKMKSKDKSRKWMWWFLGLVIALQLHFVRELVAAFALFALVFVVVGGLIAGLYAMQKVWQAAVVRVADSSHPAVNAL